MMGQGMRMDVRMIRCRPGVTWPLRGIFALAAAIAIACILGYASAPSASAAKARKTPQAYALIDVTVASLWARPSEPRRVDAPSLTNPVNLGAWLGHLTTAQRVWLTGRLIDQGSTASRWPSGSGAAPGTGSR